MVTQPALEGNAVPRAATVAVKSLAAMIEAALSAT
jgi:hypothetical protein